MMEKIRKTKGITLIALVITIIILLILAGISIATLTGDNGILTKAQIAKEETQKASEEEQRQLAILKASMNTENYDYPVEDGKVTIPAGFAPTEIEGENSIKEGVVVVDENGNEFVWIPCTTAEYNKARDTEEWSVKQYVYNGGEWGDSQPTIIGTPSIEKYKGFYVARYEAGIPSNAPFYPNESNGNKYFNSVEGEQTKDTDKYTPVSKKGEPAWNYLGQTKAKEASKKMVSNGSVQSYLIDSHAWDTICRVIQKYDSKKSLVDSHTWGNYFDNNLTNYEKINTLYALHQVIDNKWAKVAESYSKGTVLEAPKGIGDNRIELSTGASDDFKAFNIYDLAGNMWEWTTENGKQPDGDQPTEKTPTISDTDIGDANCAVIRGGTFGDSGETYSVALANGGRGLNSGNINIGYRVILYLKP